MDGEDAILFHVGQVDLGPAVRADRHRLARALAVDFGTGDDVAIGARRQTRLQSSLFRKKQWLRSLLMCLFLLPQG